MVQTRDPSASLCMFRGSTSQRSALVKLSDNGVSTVQLGHQAANCKVGNIPWRIVFGDEAFLVRKPVFWTDVLSKREARKVDYAQLEEAAVLFAQEQASEKGLDYEEIRKVAEASKEIDAKPVLTKRRRELEIEEEEARRAADPKADVPEGWNVAFVCPFSSTRCADCLPC